MPQLNEKDKVTFSARMGEQRLTHTPLLARQVLLRLSVSAEVLQGERRGGKC